MLVCFVLFFPMGLQKKKKVQKQNFRHFKKPQVRAKSRVKGYDICSIKLHMGFPNAFDP